MLSLSNCISSANYIPFSSTKSLSLDGSNDYLDVGTGIDLGTDDFSISLWVKTDDFNNKFFLSEYADDNNRWYLRGGDGDPPRLQFYQVIGGVATSLYLGSSISLDDHQNAWTHILLTSDRDGKVISYINGVADSADKNGNATNLTTTASTVIGKYAASTYSDYQIDEVAIWNSVLPAAAVTALYDNGNPTELTSAKGDYTAQANLVSWWRMGDGGFDNISVVHDQVNPGFGSNLVVNADFSANEAEDQTYLNGGLQFDNWIEQQSSGLRKFELTSDGQGIRCTIETANDNNWNQRIYQDVSSVLTVGDVYEFSVDVLCSLARNFEACIETAGGAGDQFAPDKVALSANTRTVIKKVFRCTATSDSGSPMTFHLYPLGDVLPAGEFYEVRNPSLKKLNGNPGLVIGGVSSFSDSFSNSFN